ncbi:MAG: tetratricopeptide repeat protein, partial [Rhodospirillales bacterium]|nr:tetratricopeptide repeat protein [Rhodospirillales bacterium]
MGPEQNSDPDLKAAMDQARSHLSGGRPERAEKIYRKILESDPDHPDAHGNLGFALHAQGRLDEAVDSYSRAVALKSGWAGLHYNLGAALRQLGRLEEAVASHQAALAADPANGDAQTSLAGVFKDLGRFDEAAASFNLALEIDPVSALTHYNFANLLKGMGRLEEAIDRYGSALGIDGDFHQAHSNLGLALQEAGRLGEAAASYRSALDLEPGSAEVHYNLGTVCKDQDKLDEAVACYQSSLALKSDFLDAHINLGNALQHLGQLDEAMASYRAALEIDPASFEAGSNLLYVMLNVPGLTPEQLFDEHRRILADQLQGIAPIAEPFTNDQTAGRKLRIGYLTSDFRIHPVGSMILSLFEFHDRAKFEIFCYAQVTNPDAMTEQFRAGADHWHVVVGMGDAELAQLMRRHGIDLLVSLAGLTDDNRPLVCAHRAAPVQVSYLDGKSSALDEMDYWLSDGFLHPLDTTEKFTETIYRLPHFLQWPPPGDAPPVAGLPADKSGTISFGSFNNPAKVTTKAIDLWAEILNSVAGSRLVFKYKGL